ncbi:CLUMA_CG002059, isoform B [Clunio marinus]|uniref:CLUMA_CG002059, isoform B n=1 Tax=Clunio marinus TaxID=568069 RepID=A0A1J1HJP2_9DIPT|nr:CLUMA_CG002059, isoform B [Clunio marinus]
MKLKVIVTSRVYQKLFILVLLLQNSVSGQIDWAEDDDDPVSTVSVEAVLGRTATLPCDIEPGPEARDDRVYMVLWFRESAGKPLYSFDVRGRAFSKALYWSDTNAFGPRAYFLTVSKPATLSVDNVQLDDEGVYRCRVDFQNSPTRNHRINLTVIVPPHQILVYDASGRDVAGSVGPLLEDNNLVLTCEVRGGRPEPVVQWFSGSTPIPTGGGVSMGRHVTVNRLEIQHVKRDALNNTYVCQASNTKLVPPAERTVRVEMLLRPISTSIVHKPKQLATESQITLSCEVEGSVPDTDIKWTQNNRVFERGSSCFEAAGRPEPVVQWFSGSTPIPTGGGVSMGRHVTVNRLEIQHVKRDALNNTYVCQASNTKLVPPAERTVRVEMLLRPISTSIVHKPKQLATESQITLSCEVEGSVPDTDIKWTQNNRVFERGSITNATNSSTVISALTFRPLPSDDGTKLKCEGSNPRLPNSALEDTLIMNVMYPPQVTLSLGSTLNPDDIKEGDDVYFECNIKANPKEHRITWSHDGLPVTQNVSWGVIISTRSLVLQRVGRNHSGMYACSAANDRGETQSSLVSLRIHYAPVCISSSVTIVGASIDESVAIPCRISADPQKVTFEWTFSNSGERYEVPSGHYTTIQNFHTDIDHIYLDADENGTNGNAKPAPLRNCTLRPYSSPSSIATTAIQSTNSSTYSLPSPQFPPYVNNQIVNGGQHLKELNYITTEYEKDKNLLVDRRKVISSKQPPLSTHSHHQIERNFYNGKNMSLLNARHEIQIQQHQQQQQQHKNNTNFSDNKINDRYKSNLKSLKRRTTTRNESVREVKSSANNTKHVNFNKQTASSLGENQYLAESSRFAYLRSSTTVSKYHTTSAIKPNSYSAHSPFANQVHTETVEQPSLMELECIAGYDGGLPQYFFLEAYDSRTRKLRLNITSALNDVPLFRIDLADLLPSDSYTPTLHLVAYSVNQKGRSEPTVLEDIAINEAEKRTGKKIFLPTIIEITI